MAEQDIKEYHLYKFDPSKIKLAVRPLLPYFESNREKAIKAHRHSYYQLILFSSPGRHFVDYEVVDHPENTVFALHPGQIHYFCPDAKNDGVIVQFNEQFLMRFDANAKDAIEYELFNEIRPQSFIVTPEVQGKVNALLEMLQSELTEQRVQYPDQSYYLLRSIINLLERTQAEQIEHLPKKEKDFELALRFKRLIKENMATFPSLDQYSSWLHTSSKTLTRISKQYLLDTPANIIRKRKNLEAKRLLANKKMNIKEVGYSLGFDEPSNFTKYFSKAEGMTPKQFQKQIP